MRFAVGIPGDYLDAAGLDVIGGAAIGSSRGGRRAGPSRCRRGLFTAPGTRLTNKIVHEPGQIEAMFVAFRVHMMHAPQE